LDNKAGGGERFERGNNGGGGRLQFTWFVEVMATEKIAEKVKSTKGGIKEMPRHPAKGENRKE